MNMNRKFDGHRFTLHGFHATKAEAQKAADALRKEKFHLFNRVIHTLARVTKESDAAPGKPYCVWIHGVRSKSR